MTDDELTLNYDPFQGDFGDQSDRALKNKMGIARKPGPCHDCTSTIQPGERVRMQAGVYDGTMMSYRWCAACCAAMAASYIDGGKAMEERLAIGWHARMGHEDQSGINPKSSRPNEQNDVVEEGKQ